MVSKSLKIFFITLRFFIPETLEWLKLGDNQLKEIPTNALQNLTKLRGLDLRGNQIRAVYTKSFSNFGKKLKFLYLQKNK